MRQFLCTAYTFLKMKGTTEMSEYQIYMSIGEMLLQDFERIAFQPSLYHSGVDYGLLGWFRGTLSAFQLVQAAYCRNYYELPLKHRAKISTMLLRCNTPDTAMAALGTISSLGIDQPFTEIGSSRPPITLFEAVANRFGSELFEPSYQPSSKELFKPLWDSSEVDQENGITLRPLFDPKTYPLCGWQALVGHILNKGADPNRCGLFGTPLIQMLRGAYSWGWREVKLVDVPHRSFGYRYIFRRPHRKGSEVLLTWLQTLRGFGIDLERYGKSEHKLFYRKDSPGRDLRLCDVGGDIYHLRLVGLQVGPAPEDWNVWLSEPSDEFARDFWDMLEHPERTIPGAWDDFTW
jgi:hypothetical protein